MAGLDSLQVLIVDDNQHMRTIVATILDGVGVRYIKQASNGAEALDILRTWPMDLAIIDYAMEPLDGVEFTRMVRNASDSKNPYLPVILMTAHSDRRRIVAARDAGVFEIIVKPMTAKALMDRLQAIIERPRPFVRNETFFGPDRRRQKDPAYQGPFRRGTDGMLD